MAEREKTREELRRTNPKALEIIDLSDKICLEIHKSKGTKPGASVIVTEDMTREEEEMAIFEGYLKKGYSPEEADVLATSF